MTCDHEMISDITHRCKLGNSDHDVLLIKVDYERSNILDPSSNPVKKLYSKGDYASMRQEFAARTVQGAFMNCTPNEGWELFSNTIKELSDRYIPTREIKPCSCMKRKPPWMNERVLHKIKKKHKAYRKYLITRSDQDYEVYVVKRNKASKAVRKAVKEYEKSVATEAN